MGCGVRRLPPGDTGAHAPVPGQRGPACPEQQPLLAWLAADYPELFGAADLHRRLWLYALAYTIRQIIFWPPDRAEADDLEVTHPLHTLRRLIDAPLPLRAAGLP